MQFLMFCEALALITAHPFFIIVEGDYLSFDFLERCHLTVCRFVQQYSSYAANDQHTPEDPLFFWS